VAYVRHCKRETHDITRHVRSADAPERQKNDGVHYAGDRRHSQPGVRCKKCHVINRVMRMTPDIRRLEWALREASTIYVPLYD
jgi:hypothetical protein